jgi:hypothetical protein
VLQEHFSKEDVKGARGVFRQLLERSSAIIEQTRAYPTPHQQKEGLKATQTDLPWNRATVEAREQPNLYAVGDRVLCNYCNHGQWCPGTIASSRSGGRYDISYDDGDTEQDREEEAVMPRPGPHQAINHFSHRVGDRVLGNYDGRGIWFEGVLAMVVQEGEGDEQGGEGGGECLYDVEYFDGDVEYGIPATCLILARPPQPPR